MIYRNYCDLGRDLMDWSSRLPRFAAIVGVPRSGCIIASMLATFQNTHLISMTDLICGIENWKEPLRRNCPASDGPILVVDDTVATGNRMNEIRGTCAGLPYDVKFGAYLAMNGGRHTVDYFCEDVGNTDHLFQFNIFHHWFNSRTLTDLDGVLCEDWNHNYEDGDLEFKYFSHLVNARCLVKPSFRLAGIVTGRLEKHRERTVAWLDRNGIQYDQLFMYPADSPQARHDVGVWKGEIFHNSNAIMFVESDPVQSQQIKATSGRDVLDWANQCLI